MHDLHTHTYHSDGVLGYAELARRCRVLGYRGLVISDHCDHGNLAATLEAVITFCREGNENYAGLRIVPGCELTHVPPPLIPDLIYRARELGAAVVLVHGETITEPVEPGINSAAIEGKADVLAHPGLITVADAERAAANEVRLEISGRKGHGLANGHVAKTAIAADAMLSYGSDGHAPGDYLNLSKATTILKAAGLSGKQAETVFANNASLFGR